MLERAIATDGGVRIPGEIVSRLVDGQHPVRAYREYHNMTLEALGTQVGVTETYIDAVERGTHQLSKKLLMKIASVFKIETDDLEP